MFLPAITCIVCVFSASTRISSRLSGMKALRVAGMAAVAVCLLAAMPLAAQTVHFSGPGSPLGSGFSGPFAVALDGNGNVFVADFYNNAVKEIVAGTGGAAAGTVNSSSTVNTLGSGFSYPTGVALDVFGDVFVADSGNGAVKEIVAGTGGAAAGTVNSSLDGEPVGRLGSPLAWRWTGTATSSSSRTSRAAGCSKLWRAPAGRQRAQSTPARR